MRKISFLLLALIVLILGAGCSGAKTLNPVSTGEELSALIEEIGEVSLEREFYVENLYVLYTQLDESEQAKVSNYGVLKEARETVARLYNSEPKDGERIDRSRIIKGTYCFYTRTEERLQWFKEANFDVIVSAPYDMEFLDLCLEYEIGAFLSYLPSWYGGDGTNSGQMAESRPLGCYDSYAEKFVDHPAIWALDVGDEPSSADIPHYGKLIDEAKALFPGKFIYLNLYPNYANPTQMGVNTYTEYIDVYKNNVNTDYISFDFYSIDEYGSRQRDTEFYMIRHVDNLGIVAEACREKGADLWAVMQAGESAFKGDGSLSLAQLNSQLYSALAFGARAINWACWEDGWFNEGCNIINPDGTKNPVYEHVKEVNQNVDDLAPVYMKYVNRDTAFMRDISDIRTYGGLDYFEKLKTKAVETEVLTDLKLGDEDESVIVGVFEKLKGEGDAFMFANLSDFFGEGDLEAGTEISFKLAEKGAAVFIYYPDYAYELLPDNDGVYSFFLKRTDGAFVTVEKP